MQRIVDAGDVRSTTCGVSLEGVREKKAVILSDLLLGMALNGPAATTTTTSC